MANIEFRRTSVVNTTKYNIVNKGLVIPGAYAIVEGEGLTLNNSVIRNNDGTYKPLLKSVKVSVEGDLGMLLRAEVSFTVQTDADFSAYQQTFLSPNKKVTIKYGYDRPHPGWANGGGTGYWKDMVIFDFSFAFDSVNQVYTCSFKAMGSASITEDLELHTVVANGIGQSFKISVNGEDKDAAVIHMLDLIQYDAQQGKGEVLSAENIKSGDTIEVEGGHIVLMLSGIGGSFARLMHPILKTLSVDTRTVKPYVSLNYIVNRIINNGIMAYHQTTNQTGTGQVLYKIQPETISLPLLCSADPMNVIFTGGDAGIYTSDVFVGDDTYGMDFSKSTAPACLTGDKANIGNILISYDAIANIVQEAMKSYANSVKAEKTTDSSKRPTILKIKDFIEKLSALINNASGGLWDIGLLTDESSLKEGGTPTMLILDRNYRGAATATPRVFNNRYPGDGVTMTADLEGEIAKDQVAQNAYGSGRKGEAARDIAKQTTIKNAAALAHAIVNIPLKRTEELPAADFDSDSCESLATLMKAYVDNQPVEVLKKFQNLPMFIKLKLKVMGVEGFRFGDLISVSYFPPGYKNVVFRVLKYTSTIEGNTWYTEVESVADVK
jgi:hypothetical protein